ncbi:recombinase family protein [Chenggangzhangella methanolivorans]|uniref:Recombinase family protein n=3 Tax=Chenggangzhangella methanolivorans TaxID=1437009 RepID=A0A9E6RIT3_9HYPH|nr:recombinase family protein [Chenggangzhangella methanolivorans]
MFIESASLERDEQRIMPPLVLPVTLRTLPGFVERTKRSVLIAEHYGRTSTDEQDSGPTQEAACRAAAAEHRWQSGDFHYDHGLSGVLPMEERPKLERLYNRALAGEFDVLTIATPCRFARSLTSWINAWAAFRLRGVKLYDCSSRKFIDDPISAALAAGVAAQDYESTANKLYLGMLKAANDGYNLGGIPYGFTIGRERGTIREDPINGPRVVTILGWLAAGVSPQIIKYLVEAKGWESPRGFDGWWESTIVYIATNPAYIGMIRWRATTTVDKVRLRNPDDQIIYVRGLHEALVTDDIFYAAAARVAGTSKSIDRSAYFLEKKVKCPTCDGFMGKAKHNFDCNHKGDNRIRSTLPRYVLIEAVLSIIKDLIPKLQPDGAFIESTQANQRARQAEIDARKSDIRTRIKRIDDEISEIIDLKITKRISNEHFNDKHEPRVTRKNELYAILTGIKDVEITPVETQYTSVGAFAKALEEFGRRDPNAKDNEESALLVAKMNSIIHEVRYRRRNERDSIDVQVDINISRY